MRKDMYKVIVERPRRGGGYSGIRKLAGDLEEAPVREGLRWRHTQRKWLNENLRPLERYLQQQVGRPWDKVFSEICAGIDRRNTVQQHIHQHLDDFVAIKVVAIGGVLHVQGRWGDPCPLEEYWAPRFYVDPANRLLRLNKLREKARRARHEERSRRERPREERRDLEPFRQLHQLDGLWYEVDLAPVPATAGGNGIFDVVRHRFVVYQRQQGAGKTVVHGDARLYGRDDVYAWRKRQLGAREMRQHGLANST